MFSKAEIILKDGKSFPSWTFGPIGIHPDYKRKGYGLKLLKFALEKARKMGIGFICMEGNIRFYQHAGFVLASSFNIHYHSEPPESEVPFFLAQELIPGYIKGIEGTYTPPKGYFVAEDHPEDFAIYEATFPKKEKHLLPGQLPNFCNSCGMPLKNDSDCGTFSDKTINFDYCKYCYDDGKFLQDCTMEQMIEHCCQFLDKINEQIPYPMTKEQYKDMMNKMLPMLKRWKK